MALLKNNIRLSCSAMMVTNVQNIFLQILSYRNVKKNIAM